VRRGAVWSTLVCGVALSGCGGGSGTKTFSHPGFAIHFSYPGELQSVPALHSASSAGRSSSTTTTGLGIGGHDLIAISRGGNVPITASNIRIAQPALDMIVSRAFRHSLTSQVTTVGGEPALSYPPVAAPGQPGVMSRVTLVFVAGSEYELNCQYTSGGRARIVKACEQMLSTLHT
jgi:hypothetical protein